MKASLQRAQNMSEVIFFSLGFFIAAFIVVYIYLTWHFNHWKKLGLAGPKPSIIFGNFPNIITGKRCFIYDVDDVYSQYKHKNSAVGVFMTRYPKIMILDPKVAQECMVTNFRKYRDNLSSKYLTNVDADKFAARNPFFVTGEDWKVKRADALAGLTLHKLSLAYPIWRASAKKLGKYLNELTAGRACAELDIKDLSYRFTADILGDFLWGIDSGALTITSQSNTIVEMGHKMLKQSFAAIEHYYYLHLVPFMRRFIHCNVFPKETDAFFSNLTKDAMALRLNSPQLDRADYLNYVMQLQEKKNLSHDDLMGHTMTVLLDGFETSAILLYHSLFYLAKYSQVQDKLRVEIKANLEDDGSLTFENLNKLEYLDQCVHETLRLVTLLPTFSRICTEDTTLEVELGKSISVKKGTVIIVPIFSFHHDPEYFPEPYKYYPERFDNGAHVEMTKRGVFMPFGDGPRICLGMRMGLIEVKMAIVEILKQYRLLSSKRTLAEKKPDAASFIFGLSGEFWLDFEKI